MTIDENHKLEKIRNLSAGNEWPEFLEIHLEDASAEFQLNIQESLAFFEGHFPEQPVLPGVVQTHWAGELTQLLFDINTAFSGLENVKFQSVILPNQQVTLSLRYKADKNLVTFKYANGDQKFSEGRLRF